MDKDGAHMRRIQTTTPQQIEEYYRSCLKQANACWVACLTAGGIGLAIIVIGALGMFLGAVREGQVFLAAGLVIDATAFLFHRQCAHASARMAQRAQDLLRVQLLLFAFELSRVVKDPERQDDSTIVIITSILSSLTDARSQ